jgi:hypothetical protein
MLKYYAINEFKYGSASSCSFLYLNVISSPLGQTFSTQHLVHIRRPTKQWVRVLSLSYR